MQKKQYRNVFVFKFLKQFFFSENADKTAISDLVWKMFFRKKWNLRIDDTCILRDLGESKGKNRYTMCTCVYTRI